MVVKEFDYKGNTALQPERREPKRKRKHNRRTEIEKKKAQRLKQKKTTRSVLQVALLIAVLGLVTIGRDSKVYKTQVKISELNKEIKLMTNEVEALEVELLKVGSLEYIENTAKEKLNMIMPTKENIVKIAQSEN